VSIDLAVATPAFLDLTFVGLTGLPRAGEERFATDLRWSPGGGAITAIGAARLGLSVALVAPLGDDEAGRFIRAALAHEGVATPALTDVPTPVATVMPVGGERAFVSFDPGTPVAAGELEPLEPRALVAGRDQLALAPPGTWVYATWGDRDVRVHREPVSGAAPPPRALLVNEREAKALTGMREVRAAVERLGGEAETVVVTLGADGAMAVVEGRPLEAPGVNVGAAVDTTGAGDLFAAAYAWADQRGAGVEERLRWAVLAAALSVTEATGAAGAVTESTLLKEGARRGLRAPRAPAQA
jgi:sugar/nucleoside kinase (ribokinase family)